MSAKHTTASPTVAILTDQEVIRLAEILAAAEVELRRLGLSVDVYVDQLPQQPSGARGGRNDNG